MAVKASNGITITDVTDAYAVMLSSEAVSVPGNSAGAEVASVPSGHKVCWYTGSSTTAAKSVAAGTALNGSTGQYSVAAEAVNGTLLVTAKLETA